MVSPFNSVQLAAIEQEVRQCFLQEDAPEHLASLEKHLLQLEKIGGINPNTNSSQWRELTRSIHTLKGSASLSQLHNLGHLAHRLEDVLLALGDQRLPDPQLGLEILLLGVDEMRQLLQTIVLQDQDCSPSPLVDDINLLLSQCQVEQDQTGDDHVAGQETPDFNLAQMVLDTDFKDCVSRTQAHLQTQNPNQITQALSLFSQDCLTLGEILKINWLIQASHQAQSFQAHQPEQVAEIIAWLDRLEIQRQDYLKGVISSSPTHDSTLTPQQPSPPTIVPPQADRSPTPDQASAPQPSAQPQPSTTPVIKSPISEVTLRVPVQQLDKLTNTVGDLVIQSERLTLNETRLRQASQGLKKQTRRFFRLRERIQNCYDELLLPGLMPQAQESPWGTHDDRDEFDPLELDRFTDLHSLLQDLQEFLARIDEYADDIELCTQSFQESQTAINQQLSYLRGNLTETRMVQFSTLADRFRRAIWDLNKRYHKDVKLIVKGEDVELDRAVLEALYDPLLHLIRNAFDHGQEPPQERIARGKSSQGRVILAAQQSGTTALITLTDDGRGINLEKVKAQAQAQGLLPPGQPTKAQILNCLFMPGFSTAEKVGELSGRGVGLDVVKSQLEKLRGSVQITTQLGKGSRFSLRVPSSLNILPLLLCRFQHGQGLVSHLAIPSSQVLELVELTARDLETPHYDWRGQPLRVIGLDRLVPPSDYPWLRQTQAQGSMDGWLSSATTVLPSFASGLQEGGIGVILQTSRQPFVLRVHLLLEEREMVLKPLEPWLTLPRYLEGFTLLPQGQVVPVLSPEAVLGEMDQLLAQTLPPQDPAVVMASKAQQPTVLLADDSVAARRWLAHALQPLGYQLIQCRDGQEAWDQLQGNISCALMICDVEMPRLDGFALLKQVRQSDRWAKLPVAMLTSRQSDVHQEQAKKLGATAYFVKPLGIQELVKNIDSLMMIPEGNA